MAAEILPFLAHHLAKPFLDAGVVDIVVVHPALVAGVVWRIDVDAVDLAFVLREQALEGLQVVAMDDHVAAAGGLLAIALVGGEPVLVLEHLVGHVAVVVDDLVLSDPVEGGHGCESGRGWGLGGTTAKMRNAAN